MNALFMGFFIWLPLSASAQKMKIVCYWQSIVSADVINPNLCTHIIYAFIGVNTDGELFYLNPEAPSKIASLVELKRSNPELVVMAAIGGASDQFSNAFAVLSNSHQSRSKFVSGVLSFVRTSSLLGIDIDWEYPSAEDSVNFLLLLQDLKKSFDQFNYVLSVAVAPDKWRAQKFYNIELLSRTVDFINLMTYDFHGSWDKTIGHHAQLYPHHKDTEYIRELNCAASVIFWLSKKAAAEKLVLGIPTYGNTFTLLDKNTHRIGSNVNVTMTPLSMGFNEYCGMKASGWKQRFDVDFRAYYATRERTWFGFDTTRQVKEKVKFAKLMNLGGIMFWSIDTDDQKNFCMQGNFSLISAAANEARK